MNYCYSCGTKLIQKECINCGISEGYFPYCPNCNEFRFPFFNVAVSSVTYNKDFSKILLIQQYGRKNNILIAGYVNKSETLEEALFREINEEVNLEVIDFKYNSSKYFDKSNSLICNYISVVNSENYKLTPEVDYAKWYTINEARQVVMPNSLAQYFLELSLEKIYTKNSI